MNIFKHIADLLKFRKRDNILLGSNVSTFSALSLSHLPFARLIFLNIIELLTDLINDVTFVYSGYETSEKRILFGRFKAFVELYGQLVLHRVFIDGYAVIGLKDWGFVLLEPNEYQIISEGNKTRIVSLNPDVDIYIMRSSSFEVTGQSDYQVLQPFLQYLDNVLNSSNTICERLGALVVASPKDNSASPTATVLTKDQKDKLEKELQKEYGSLSDQKVIMVLPRGMNFDTISLASLDVKTTERVKMAILAICDRIKVPSNQVAIIDANSSKTLANGSELREGDRNKYQSFERLLNKTFIRMASELGLIVDYTIYNKPQQ